MGLCKNIVCLYCQNMILFIISGKLFAYLGARAAELLIDTDQNPQCGGNGPQTLDCLCLPRARSHCCWLHSLQPQLWVCYRSWGYDCGGLAMEDFWLCLCSYWLRFREERHWYSVIQSARFVLKSQWIWSLVFKQCTGEEASFKARDVESSVLINNPIKSLETFYGHSLLWISETHRCFFRHEPFI